jgi:hypothetical protein
MRSIFLRISLVLCGLAAFAVAAAPPPAQREPTVQKELLERVGDWAEYYLDRLPSFAAEETLSQRGKRVGTRQVVSDYFSLRFPSSSRDHAEFRDLISVDGKILQSSANRDAKWPRLLAAQSWKDVEALLQSPTKYEVASEQFSGLDRLVSRFAVRYQERMHYVYAQDTSDPPSPHVLIGYRQFSGVGLAEVEGKLVFATGQAWVDPDTGHIVRIEEEIRVKQTMYSTAVEFALAPELDLWLPSAITVRVFEKGRLELESTYSYSNFRVLPAGARADSALKP